MENPTCPLCALERTPADAAGLAWSSQHEPDGSITWICPGCTRAQLWRIEALLAVASPTAPAAPVPLRRAA
jgi:cell wall assembly regulator SMI1